ncbi:MAG TPA: hypothetical protein DCZ94_12365 [Lentisphaeria bacterium]|nr:MAG: hypothetical protein A2X48_21780 [Lentisphaerae bacterium GWF2_49_21]HBC87743.1 hypothetical protein [Lentisphaeria bacterium]
MAKEDKNSKAGDLTAKPLRLLIVEDSQSDADLIIRELKRGGFDPKWKRVETSHEMEALLDGETWDVIISDFKMPNFSGLAALQLLQRKNLDIPFIIVSGTIGEETAVAVMKAGASDYIMKDNLSRLTSAVERELRESEIRKAHKKADEDLKIAVGALEKSSEEICDLYNNAPCGYHSLDKNGMFIQINDTELKWLGYSREELIGKKKFTYVIPLEDVNVFNKTFPVLRDRGYIRDIEGNFVRKDGSVFPVLINATAVKDEKGKFICSRSSVFDMTEQKRIEKDRALLSETISASLNEIYLFDSKTLLFKYVSRGALENLGYSLERILKMTPLDLKPEFDRKSFERLINPLVDKTKDMQIFETVHKRADGSVYPVEVHLQLLDHGGEKIFLSVILDITDRKHLEERLRHSEKMEAIGQLAGGVAHDFNNQLAAIMGYAEMLADRLEDKNLRGHAENIVRASRRASDLTRDLLAFSRKGKMRSIPVNIHEEIEEVVSMLERSIDKRIEIKRILKAIPSSVIGDPSQLQNALLNIAINARDAMPNGGELIFTTENLKMEESPLKDKYPKNDTGHCMKISISDSGIGMAQETIKHIFEPFFTTKERGKGTGMGLASVYGTVNNHNGVIIASSEAGHGSVFTIYFPVIDDVPDIIDNGKERFHAPKKATIMVVDDEEILSNMVASVLKPFGHRVMVCSNGTEALEMYRKIYKEIDIVILDMIMPKMSGRDTFLALKKINPDIKVILSSGYSIDGEAQSIMDAGAKSFIQKPFNINELTNTINDVLGNK